MEQLTSRTLSRDTAARLVASAAGLAISGYLAATHVAPGTVTLACATTGFVNCEQVTSSPWSMMGPVPVAFLGVVWSLAMLTLTALQGRSASHVLRAASLAWTSIGMLFVFYFIYTEIFLIGAICLWCTAVHVLVIVLFLLALNDYLAVGTEGV